MIGVVTRVSSASVSVDAPPLVRGIDHGLLVLLAIEPDDTEDTVRWMAGKIAHLRVFPDDAGKMNRSIQDVQGRVLLISQFTLAGDCSKGNRPSFVKAAPPHIAEPMYLTVAATLTEEHEIGVETGVFGASMQVSSVNEGPVTLILRSP